ncbi:hypothetical protein PhCBS80983_g00143 [Powellomyces hirtus]|uniref:Protein YAE1 n=1 Tax=Powellomyces hirtus TaxID=109895 RepID=A0A507EHV1_9FUNG|nr:hypothetical protein PhCBS80983_g00143 [Powellomyces hirtus]
MDSDDDVWGDDASIPDAQYDKQVAERNWNRLQDTHGVAGYKDGITEGKKASLQQGFDQGYGNGVDIGLQLGRLRGIANNPTRVTPSVTLERLKSHLAELEAISVEHVFTLSYFRDTDVSNTRVGTVGNLKIAKEVCGSDTCCNGDTTSPTAGQKPGCQSSCTSPSKDLGREYPSTVISGFYDRLSFVASELGWSLADLIGKG